MRILSNTIVAGLIAGAMALTSCADFLNIDNYFDDEFKIDSVFVNTRYMEAYMWGAAAMFPNEEETIRNNHTPGPMATDEAFNTYRVGNNVYHGLNFADGLLTSDYEGNTSAMNKWGAYYKIIRKCNNILANLE